MFKLEKLSDKAVLTVWGYVGGYFLDSRLITSAFDEIKQAGYKKLDFHIHTFGGAVFDGNLIKNTLGGFNGYKKVIIDGICASMGPIVISDVDEIEIVNNGFMMIHSPQGGAYGTAKQLEQNAKVLRSMEKNFKVSLVKRTGLSPELINAWFDGTDYWFDAEECKKLKLVDNVIDAKGDVVITKDEILTEGAEAVYNKFVACLDVSEPQIPTSEMNKEDLIKRYGLTTVTAVSTDEDVLAAVDAKISEGATAASTATTAAIKAAVMQAVTDKKITDKQVDDYVARGEKLGLADLTAVLGDMKAYEPISAHIVGGKGGDTKTKEDRKDWTWCDYQAKAPADLETMQKADLDTFKALYKDEYGVEPEL